MNQTSRFIQRLNIDVHVQFSVLRRWRNHTLPSVETFLSRLSVMQKQEQACPLPQPPAMRPTVVETRVVPTLCQQRPVEHTPKR